MPHAPQYAIARGLVSRAALDDPPFAFLAMAATMAAPRFNASQLLGATLTRYAWQGRATYRGRGIARARPVRVPVIARDPGAAGPCSVPRSLRGPWLVDANPYARTYLYRGQLYAIENTGPQAWKAPDGVTYSKVGLARDRGARMIDEQISFAVDAGRI